MEKKVNSQYFGSQAVESGAMLKFIKALTDMCYEDDDVALYNDIRIHPEDCGSFIVEWAQVPWDHSYGGSFQYVDEDEQVMIEREFPDKSYRTFYDEEDYTEQLKQWLIDNPGYHKNQFGRWVNDQED
ncbi:MAG: hypothetical protein J6S67_08570 [Methanobrevibacter sp.]|nr:hypothetical protein [Methanobrevibacter sp.]